MVPNWQLLGVELPPGRRREFTLVTLSRPHPTQALCARYLCSAASLASERFRRQSASSQDPLPTKPSERHPEKNVGRPVLRGGPYVFASP